MAGTRYESIERTDQPSGILRIVHKINQFFWYRDAIERTGNGDTGIVKNLSAVRFHLPYALGREAQCFLVVVGDGLNICNAYLARINAPDLLTLERPPQQPGLQQLFSYKEERQVQGRSWKTVDEPPIPEFLRSIFTTEIGPFLKDMHTPIDTDRIYNIKPSFNFDILEILAKNREDRTQQHLKITWKPDSRDGKEKLCAILSRYENVGWLPEDTEKRREFEKFTFSCPTNPGY